MVDAELPNFWFFRVSPLINFNFNFMGFLDVDPEYEGMSAIHIEGFFGEAEAGQNGSVISPQYFVDDLIHFKCSRGRSVEISSQISASAPS